MSPVRATVHLYSMDPRINTKLGYARARARAKGIAKARVNAMLFRARIILWLGQRQF